jgi:hypothetical protein
MALPQLISCVLDIATTQIPNTSCKVPSYPAAFLISFYDTKYPRKLFICLDVDFNDAS